MNMQPKRVRFFGEKMGLRGKIFNQLLLALVLGLGLNMQKAQAENGEVLFGLAAITAATSVPVVSAIQANSQVNQATTRANAANAISQINSQTALFQARTQSYVALAQAGVQRDIAAFTQQSQTRDLLSQLQFMAYNRALDNQLQQQQLAAQMQLQNNLLALELKKMELNQILAESQALSGEAPSLQTPPSSQSAGGSLLSPIAQTLQGSQSGINTTAQASANPFSTSSSSLGMKRALGRSLSNGSTLARKRVVASDLSQMLGAIPRRPPSLQDTTSPRRALRTVASQTH